MVEMIAFANERVAAGRWVTGGLAVIQIKRAFDKIEPRERPADEKTWRAFADKHLAFGFAGADELMTRFDPSYKAGTLRCIRCGAAAKAGCDCGARCVPVEPSEWDAPEPAAPTAEQTAPTALERATAAVAAHPEMSDRAIAKLTGISRETVRRARAAAGDTSGDTSPADESASAEKATP